VAIPAAMAFFKADVPRADVMWTAAAFIVGLLAVVIAQSAAFFTMAKRAEAQDRYRNEQINRIAAVVSSRNTAMHRSECERGKRIRLAGNRKLSQSDIYRMAGLICFGGSLIAFVLGCGWGRDGSPDSERQSRNGRAEGRRFVAHFRTGGLKAKGESDWARHQIA